MRHATGRVHDQIGLDLDVRSFRLRPDAEAAVGFLDRLDRGLRAHVDPDCLELVHEPPDQLRLEMRQHPRSSLQDRYLRACAGGDMGELCGDVTAADHDDALRQGLQFEELLVRDQMFLAGNAELHGRRARCDQDVARLEMPAVNCDAVLAGESGAPMKCGDALLCIALLVAARHRIGEAALERDEIRPV